MNEIRSGSVGEFHDIGHRVRDVSLEPYAKKLAALPSQASRVLTQMESGGLTVQLPQVMREVRAVARSVDRLTGGVVFAALLMGGVLLSNAGNVTAGNVLFGASGATLL